MAKKNLEYRGFKSTELVLFFFVMFCGTALQATGQLTKEWIDLVIWTYGIYVGGRGVAKGSEAIKEAKQPQSNYMPGVP